MTAEQLIDQLLEAKQKTKYGAVVKGDELSGSEIASLRPKQAILVKGKRAVVLGVVSKGNNIELTYAAGAKTFSRDRYLTIKKTDQKTSVQHFTRVGYDQGVTTGAAS